MSQTDIQMYRSYMFIGTSSGELLCCFLQNISVVNTVIHIMSTDALYGLNNLRRLRLERCMQYNVYIYNQKRTQSLYAICILKMYHSHPLFESIISVAVKGSQQENTLYLLRVFPLAKSRIIYTWKTGLVMTATPVKSMVKLHIHGFKSIYFS